MPLFLSIGSTNVSWKDLNAPMNGYVMVGDYIQNNSNADEVIWADSSAEDKMAWLTG